MSTRSVVARAKGIGRFEGTYVHSDGYPRGVGKGIWNNIQKYGAEKVLHRLLIEHTAGWSHIWHNDLFDPEPINARDVFANMGDSEAYTAAMDHAWYYPEHEGSMDFDEETIKTSWTEYAYLIDPAANTMTVLEVRYQDEPIVMAVLDLAGDEPGWGAIENGSYATEGQAA